MPSIDLTQIKVFLAAAEENNFSAAAKRLHMSQSAVSQNIQSLERNYNIELFIRNGRTVHLSEAGHKLLPIARETINTARLLEDTMLSTNETIGGELSIGCSTSAGRYLIPSLLSMFQEEYPNVRALVRIMSRDNIAEGLIHESIPIGLASCKIEHHELECIPMFEDKIILIASSGHPWAVSRKAMPADLLDQRFILRETSSGTNVALSEGLKPHGITQDMLNIVMTLGSAEAIEMAVERSMNIAFVSEMVAARGLAMGRIIKVDVEGLDLRRMVYMARRVGYPFTRAQSLFWNFAQAMRDKLNTDIWQSLTSFEPVP